MSCKHEIELNANIGRYEEVELDYSCDKCNRSIPEEDIIHITKETHDLNQAVVEAADDIVATGEEYCGYYQVSALEIESLKKALTALEGD